MLKKLKISVRPWIEWGEITRFGSSITVPKGLRQGSISKRMMDRIGFLQLAKSSIIQSIDNSKSQSLFPRKTNKT